MTGPPALEVSTNLDDLFAAAVAGGDIPGAALAIGRGETLLLRRCYGKSATRAAPIRPVTAETRYDLASLTKVIATTTLVLRLIERGQLHLDDPVVRYLPECRASGWENISLWHLLTHSSGLPATRPFWAGVDRPLDLVQALSRTPPEFAPGERVQYSDLGFMALGEVCARVEGSPLEEVFLRTLARPLGLEATSYGPLDPSVGPIAATEVEPNGTSLLGVVHDENARAAGGVSGHAGLFSTLSDLERFARVWVGRTGPPARAWRERAVLPQVDGGEGRRGLGWTCRGNAFDILGANWPPTAVSHTGFTGTSIALDLGSGAWVVLLTNAVHLSRDRRPLRRLRLAAHELAGRLLFATPPA